MTWSDLAERVARQAHEGQVDKSGQPYIGHPQRVADRVQGDVPKAVAWLHDVIEDTDLTKDDLLTKIGFPREIVDAVVALTHLPNEPNMMYWGRVRANQVARVVKRADIADNTDPARLAALDPATRERLTRKYTQALLAMS